MFITQKYFLKMSILNTCFVYLKITPKFFYCKVPAWYEGVIYNTK